MSPTRLTAFDRNSLLLILGVWLGHFVLNGLVFLWFPGYPNDLAVQLARFACSLLAMLLCLCIHLLMRNRRGNRWFWVGALVATFPAAVLLSWLGARIFHQITPNSRAWDWLSPASMAMDYVGYQWMLLAWAALYVGMSYALDVRNRDARLAEAERQAQESQLVALRLQINPHFLFNALNTVAGLIALGRNAEAEAVVLNLSRFMRYTLAVAPSRFATVNEEIGMLQRYLDVETARFSDRLRVTYAIAPGCGDALVPALALLPLVENAIKHGLGDAEDGILIEIAARREQDKLLLWVANDAPKEHPPQDGLGIGLANVRQRLATLYDDDAAFEAGPVPYGWRATMRLPWVEEAT